MPNVLRAHQKDLGGFHVTRILPHKDQFMIGPFIFLDRMGPAEFPPGKGIDVRPHPHIGLATLSYLFEGSMLHRDSLGNTQEILPGDVNWMTAGKGIVHSERETLEVRAKTHSMDGLQCWIALPKDKANMDPSFQHVKKEELPHIIHEGVLLRLIAGEAYDRQSPVSTYSPMMFLDVIAVPGTALQRPNPDYECAIYVQWGELEINDTTLTKGQFAVLSAEETEINVSSHSRFMLLGGEAFSDRPLIEWNFVAYSKERMQQATQDWREGRFPLIPSDQNEYIPY